MRSLAFRVATGIQDYIWLYHHHFVALNSLSAW